ncbi:MAG: NADH-quinone oxidoreductase subunit A, partial [Planctomycetota bacterium]
MIFASTQNFTEFFSYGAVLFFFIASMGLCIGMITANRILGAGSNPNPDKIESYECGEEPIGSAWLRFNIRFYMIALVFVVFDVELALVFPIACVLRKLVYTTTTPGAFVNPMALVVAGELLLFVGVLFLGLVYIWKKNDLGWNRVYRENADLEELVQQRLAHLPPVKIRPRTMPPPPLKPAAAKPAAVAAP